MKGRLRNYSVMGILAIALFTGGCGGIGKDSPGVTVSATITPTYNGIITASVDAGQNICTSTSSAQTQPEYFADHMATASLSARLINQNSIVKQMTVTLDNYTIDYRSSADSPGAPPIQSDTREKTISFVVSAETTSTDFPVEFVDLIRKNQYLSDVTGGTLTGQVPLNNYTATFTFHGHSENGVSITFSAQTDFQVGDFNMCPDGFF
jgi:hypothetical protein